MTREEIVRVLAERLARKELFPLSGTTAESRVLLRQGGAAFLQNDANVDALVAAWRDNNTCVFGASIIAGIKEWMVDNKATVDVEAALSPDDTLDLSEIEQLL